MNLRHLLLMSALSLNLTATLTAKEPKWKMIWHDEFNKKGKIDEEKWSKIPRGTSDWNNYMSDDERLYAVKEGKLILRGMVNDRTESDTARYITGGVYTQGKFALDYGKVEIRAKLPNATGCWPAFWMLPDDKRIKWPNGGEIDIMEHLNHDTIVYQTTHSYYTFKLEIKDNPKHYGTAPIDKHGFNTYAVEKRADKLIYSVNGIVTYEYPRIETDKEGQYPFDNPYYILMDMQLGGSWVGEVDPAQLPVEMEIDWIRVYKQK